MGSPMVTRTVLMPFDLWSKIDAYATASRVSFSQAIRTLAEKGLNDE